MNRFKKIVDAFGWLGVNKQTLAMHIGVDNAYIGRGVSGHYVASTARKKISEFFDIPESELFILEGFPKIDDSSSKEWTQRWSWYAKYLLDDISVELEKSVDEILKTWNKWKYLVFYRRIKCQLKGEMMDKQRQTHRWLLGPDTWVELISNKRLLPRHCDRLTRYIELTKEAYFENAIEMEDIRHRSRICGICGRSLNEEEFCKCSDVSEAPEVL